MSCKDWGESRKKDCAQEADQGHSECAQKQDQGKNECRQQEDRGYNSCSAWSQECCTWWPCSWACQALTWVCRGWVWVSNIVCVLWVWVSNWVCVAWTWIKNMVCVAWVTTVTQFCRIWETVFGSAPWEAARRRSVDLSNLGPFPPGFMWGVATAGYQVEGAIENNDWAVFTTSKAIHDRVATNSAQVGLSFDLRPAGEAVQHHDLDVLKGDLSRARALGLRAYRLSIEWSRVQPDGTRNDDGNAKWSSAGLDYYRGVLQACRDAGLEPVVTLNHLTLPDWVLTPPRDGFNVGVFASASHDDPAFRGSLRGWENMDTVDRFVEFVEKVATEFKELVRWWVVLNEPVGSLIGAGYLGGVWSPGFTADVAGKKIALDVYSNLLHAHVQAFNKIKELYGDAESHVGIAHAMMFAKKVEDISGSVVAGVVGGAAAGAAIGGAIGAVTGLFVVGLIVGAAVGAVGGAIGGLVMGLKGNDEPMKQFDYFTNWHFLDSLISGTVDTAFTFRTSKQKKVDARDYFGLPTGDDAPPWTPRLDFIGVNYYRSAYVYYFLPLENTAPYQGGAIIVDHNKPGPAHNLANAMGWEISPEGFYFVLADINSRYMLGEGAFPILITENGLPEPHDANRAPYVIAHLEHLLAAIRDGADIRGYLCWSLLDNFEWAENYNERAKFGLFRIEDPGGADDHAMTDFLKRHLTEGALALQYVIAETAPQRRGGAQVSGVGLARDNFGTINSDGTACLAPTMTAGAFFACGIDPSKPEFTVYLDPLTPAGTAEAPQERWTGMIFYHREELWAALAAVEFDSQTKVLSFGHGPCPSVGAPVIPQRSYTAVAADGRLTESTIDGAPAQWQGRKIEACGAWKAGGKDLPDVVTLFLYEGGRPFSSWKGKFLGVNPDNRPFWFALDDPVAIGSDGTVRLDFAQTGTFVGSLTNGQLSGALTYKNTNRAPITWTATRLPDGLPF